MKLLVTGGLGFIGSNFITEILKNNSDLEITNIDGVIASNTSTKRDNLLSENKIEKGGLSGKPISKKSTEVIRYLYQESNGSFPIIGVGGVHSEKDALEKLKAGATLIQIYTGFIYEGPRLVKRINRAILKEC